MDEPEPHISRQDEILSYLAAIVLAALVLLVFYATLFGH